MEFNRTKNSQQTIVWGVIYRIVVMLFPFAMRTIVIHSLGALYLGLNGLFSSVLNALNLAELGVGSALVFAMYEPVACEDKPRIKALLNFYRTAYLIIGIFITCIGVLLIPFLHFLIKGDYPSDINIYLVYLIQLLSSSVGYFLMAYKGSVLNAYQKNYVISQFSLFTDLCGYAGQIISLLVFKNYYLYVIIVFLKTAVFNLLVGRYVDKNYPDIVAEGKLGKEERKFIFYKISALMGHKMSAILINSVDNILISMFIGLEMVTIFNNYSYVVSSVTAIFMMLVSGLNSVIGNYLLKESFDRIRSLFLTIHFLLCAMICVCCACFINLFQPFMILWTGEKMLLPFHSVVLFVTYFFSIRVRTAGMLFRDAAGIWEKTIVLSYLIIVVDLVIDLILLKRIGIDGALISTIVSMLIAFFYESAILFKHVIKTGKGRYYLNTLIYVIAIVVSCALSYLICSSVKIQSLYATIIIRLTISVLISSLCFVVCTFWRKEMKNGYVLAKKTIRR